MKKRIFGFISKSAKFLCNVKETEEGVLAAVKVGEEEPEVIQEPEIAEESEVVGELATEAEEMETPEKDEETPEIITLREMFERYILSQKGILADSTLKGYENVKDNHLKSIMDKDVSTITENDIFNALDEEYANGISLSTTKKYRQIVFKVMATVVR